MPFKRNNENNEYCVPAATTITRTEEQSDEPSLTGLGVILGVLYSTESV